jgi:hypothetical protein
MRPPYAFNNLNHNTLITHILGSSQACERSIVPAMNSNLDVREPAILTETDAHYTQGKATRENTFTREKTISKKEKREWRLEKNNSAGAAVPQGGAGQLYRPASASAAKPGALKLCRHPLQYHSWASGPMQQPPRATSP